MLVSEKEVEGITVTWRIRRRMEFLNLDWCTRTRNDNYVVLASRVSSTERRCCFLVSLMLVVLVTVDGAVDFDDQQGELTML